jgi:glycerol-1-phosphate dehydrogenase [NAD(P)+]
VAQAPEHIDPTDVPGVNERLGAWAASGEVFRSVATEHVVIEDDALDALVELARSLADGERVILVVDRTPMQRGDDDLKALIEDRLAGVVPLTLRRLPDGREKGGAPQNLHKGPLPYGLGSEEGSLAGGDPPPFHADIGSARRLAVELASCGAVVSVGSGGLTDVVKYARHLAVAASKPASLPMISFPTAASVTAYTSALAVLTVDGVKRTLAAQAPNAVVCDLRTLADAPRSLTLAGFGDVLARSVAYGDWYIADRLGMADGFSELPGRLLEHAERALIDQAEGVAAADTGAIRRVLDGLLLAGMAMSIVNQTAPVSGWEHAMSHYLDLTAGADGRVPAWHGAQVGVATLVAARAYERSWSALNVRRIEQDADLPACRRTVEREFRRLDPDGRVAAEIWRDLEKKLTRWNSAASARRAFVERKQAGQLDAFLEANVRSGEAVADALARATAPQRFAELNRLVPAATALGAVQFSHLIRSRFTLGDLLSHTGWLNAETAAGLLDEPSAR